MRFDKVWTVARKDIAEFRTNKYIMSSLILVPIIMAVVLPIVYLSPFTLFSTSQTGSLDLNLNINQSYSNEVLDNVTFSNASLEDMTLTNALISNCNLNGCTIDQGIISNSFIGNSTIRGSIITSSNLLNTTTEGGTITGSFVLNEQTEDQKFIGFFLPFLMLFFILIPGIMPTVIASYSFVGEKLNRSLEPLLATPTTDLELLAGKSFSIFLPTMLATWLAFIPFTIIVDWLTTPILNYIPLPNVTWILGIFVLAPLICVLSIFLNIIVSSKVVDVRASQQIGSLVILPIVVFFVITLLSSTTLDPLNILLFAGLVVAMDVVVVFVTMKTFRREEILIKWK